MLLLCSACTESSTITAAPFSLPFTEIREAFRVLDRDGNGFISKQELGMAMRSLGYMPSEVELAIIMQRLDMDGECSPGSALSWGIHRRFPRAWQPVGPDQTIPGRHGEGGEGAGELRFPHRREKGEVRGEPAVGALGAQDSTGVYGEHKEHGRYRGAMGAQGLQGLGGIMGAVGSERGLYMKARGLRVGYQGHRVYGGHRGDGLSDGGVFGGHRGCRGTWGIWGLQGSLEGAVGGWE